MRSQAQLALYNTCTFSVPLFSSLSISLSLSPCIAFHPFCGHPGNWFSICHRICQGSAHFCEARFAFFQICNPPGPETRIGPGGRYPTLAVNNRRRKNRRWSDPSSWVKIRWHTKYQLPGTLEVVKNSSRKRGERREKKGSCVTAICYGQLCLWTPPCVVHAIRLDQNHLGQWSFGLDYFYDVM